MKLEKEKKSKEKRREKSSFWKQGSNKYLSKQRNSQKQHILSFPHLGKFITMERGKTVLNINERKKKKKITMEVRVEAPYNKQVVFNQDFPAAMA